MNTQLYEINIRYTDEASEKTREECCPGDPYMTFSATPGVSLVAVNSQQCSGLFRMSVKVSDGNTAADISTRIAKDNKHIKGNLKEQHFSSQLMLNSLSHLYNRFLISLIILYPS